METPKHGASNGGFGGPLSGMEVMASLFDNPSSCHDDHSPLPSPPSILSATMNHDHAGHNMHMSNMPMCKMHMLWNTEIVDTCIVFRSWHISTRAAFVWSCLAIVALGIFYEYLRVFQRKLDHHIALSLSTGGAKGKGRARSTGRTGSISLGPGESEGNAGLEESGLLSGGSKWLNASITGVPVPPVSRALRAIVYGGTVFISFFLMLVFMTYNAYLIFAVVVGASLGHYIFGATMDVDSILSDASSGKGMACH
ncbi:hypothetical protein D9619_011640 [Psilocybe cf. subviscida]|uniref:Copper transport protein n=1 Tax=Psilocybe cf. subviscida TaxID=2480587 RepID=A0A8H5F9M3_9AGAR|nr:hypothetical protein D9619_011640 [Psilocybe cf. subviscida]